MIYFLFKTLTVEAESNETYEPSDGLIGAAATIIDVHRSPRRDGPHTLLGFFDLKQLPPELSEYSQIKLIISPSLSDSK